MSRALGSRPFAHFSLPLDVPFVDGVSLTIPFSMDFISDTFGEIFNVGGGVGQVFACEPGIYVAQLQASVNTTPTQMLTQFFCSSGTAADSSSQKFFAGVSPISSLTTLLVANRPSGEIPYPASPPGFPVVIFCILQMNGGGNGNILASGTKMIVQQLTTY